MSLLKENERLDDLQYNGWHIIQDPKGYCFTSDSVALANFCKCKTGGVLVDLCSGSGVIGLLAYGKTKAKTCHLVEIQPRLCDMSKRSVEYNGLGEHFVFHNRTLVGVSAVIGVESVDTVVCNPPYKSGQNLKNESEEIAICRHEITMTLEDVISEAQKLLKYGGYFYMVNRTERLTDIMVLLRKYGLEPKILKVLSSSKNNTVIMIEAKKGGKSGIKIEVDHE